MSEKEELLKDISKETDYEILSETAGGKLLISKTLKEIIDTIIILSSGYRTTPEIEIRSGLAKVNVLLNLLDVLQGAKKRKESLKKELDRCD